MYLAVYAMGLFLSYKKALVLSFLSEDTFSQLSFLLDKVDW